MSAATQYPILLVAVPLLSAFLVSVAGLYRKAICFYVTVGAMGVALWASVAVLFEVLENGTIHYKLGGWQTDPFPVGIEYVIDHLNAMVLVVVAFVGFVTAIYSKRSVEAEIPDKVSQFYTLYILLVTGLLGITATGDAFNLYVLLELAALTSYALIANGEDRAPLASFNYLILGTIGACFYLLGVGHLYIMTGSLNMLDLQGIIASLYESNAIQIAFILILVGVWVKMAFFPVHDWLPNAYTFAPSATSCLMAPLMTKVSVYVMIRIMFSVFSPEFTFDAFVIHKVIVWLAVIAIVAGSLRALAEKDFKKMLTYLIVAEVGYMVGGVWLANRMGITGAVLHILNDAMMTLCLFMVAGIVMYKKKAHGIEDMRGLFRKMPFTMAAFVVGALAMIGVPPTCGFFSKWYLILGAIDASEWGYLGALLFSSLVNAVLFFRIIEVAYFDNGAQVGAHGDAHESATDSKIDEAPLTMLVPLLIVAVCLVVIGLCTGVIVDRVIQFTVPLL